MKVFALSYDLLIAAMIALALGALTFSQFQQIRALEKPTFTLLGTLREGENHFGLVHESACVGEAQVTVGYQAESGTPKVTGQVRFGVILRTVRIDPQLEYELYFNPLGQLTIGQLHFTVNGSKFTVLLTEANPIKISAWSGTSMPEQKITLEIPGPLLFTRLGQDRYSVGYPIRGGRLPTFLKAVLPEGQQGPSPMHIPQVVPGDGCQNTINAPFDLTSLASYLEKFAPYLGMPSLLVPSEVVP